MVAGGSYTGGRWDLNMDFATIITPSVSSVPVPAAAWLFGSGLLGLIGVARRRVS